MLVARGRDSTMAGRSRRSVSPSCSTFLITAGPIRGAGASPCHGVPAVPRHPADVVVQRPGGAADGHAAAAHRARRGDRVPVRVLQHRRRRAVPARRDRRDAPRHPPRPTCPPASRCRSRCVAGAAAGLLWALLPAWLKRVAGDRRGGHDAAAEPGRAAAPPGTAQRAVAPPDQRVPRLRDVRARATGMPTPFGRPGARRSDRRRRADRRRPPCVMAFTPLGLRIKAAGPVARRGAVLRHPRRAIQWRAALVSGAVAGLAGAAQVLGVQHQLTGSIAVGYGYTGVVVATLGALSAIGVLLVALLLGDDRRRSAERLARAADPVADGPARHRRAAARRSCRASRCGTTASCADAPSPPRSSDVSISLGRGAHARR